MIGSILELPFHEGAPHDVLGFAEGRDTVDHDYGGFGWTRVDRLWLADGDGATVLVERPLVLALHAADDGAALADDIELEFAVGEQTVTARLSAFLARWLPRLPAAATTVLALCNPHRARLPGPAGLRYALGPVDSWLDEGDTGEHLRLVADTWCTTSLDPASRAPEAP